MAKLGNVSTVLAFLLLTSFLLRAVNAKDVHLEIKQCPAEETTGNDSGHSNDQCTYHVDVGAVETLQLDCMVRGAQSVFFLRWIDQDGDNVNETDLEVRDRGNGTFDSTATMTWSMTDVDDGMVFTCVALEEADGGSSVSRKVTVVVEDGNALPLWLLIVIIVSSVFGLFLIAICAFMLCKYRRSLACCFCGSSYKKAPQNEELLEIQNNLAQMREQLKPYKPEYVGTVDLRTDIITVGLFGPSGGGKTELVNSLMFALQGRYKPTPKRTADETTAPPVREEHSLTDHIRFMEEHGVDIFEKKMGENTTEIIGFDDEDSDTDVLRGAKIHCPVLVVDTSNHGDANGVDETAAQVIMFAKNVKQLYGPNLKVVITHKLTATMATEDAHGLATKVGLSSGVVEGDIYVVENYTPKSHKEDPEKSLAMLKFLQGCLTAGEENLAHEIKSKTRNKLLNIVGAQAQQRK